MSLIQFKKIIKTLLFMMLTFFVMNSLTSFDVPKVELKVMTFNIRYDNPDDGINQWSNRLPVIKSYFSADNKPDIIGMQEVLHNQLIDLQNILQGYEYIGKGRDDGKTKGEYCPVFFQKEKFRLLDDGQFWLSETPEIPGSKNWDAAITRIVTWGKFEDKSSNKVFYLFNTHFDHKGIVAKQMSTDLMSEKIKAIAGDNPVIVTGDFNIRKNLKEGQNAMIKALYYSLIGTFKDNNSLHNTKTISETPTKTAGSTGNQKFSRDSSYIGEPGEAIDYIFVNEHFAVKSYRVDRFMKGNIFISDHWPVISVITL